MSASPMSAPDSQSRAARAFLMRMIKANASVDCRGSHGPYPVLVRGDRRTKPTEWVPDAVIKALLASGDLVQSPRGLRVARGTKARLENPVPERAYTEQHGPQSERNIYTPDGVIRSARVNESFHSLRRIARRRDSKGMPQLPAHLIEAGERFANDYARAHGDHITTQNYDAPIVDGGTDHGTASTARAVSRLDAHKRYAAARASMGGGLDQTVIKICCNDYALERLERDAAWAKGAGLVVLRMGLERLAEFYGTAPRGHGQTGLAVNPNLRTKAGG